MLTIDHLTKSFGTRSVLSGVSAEFVAGEYVAIIGESGVGKSTLLNLIAGLDVADTGRIVLDGVDLTTLDDDARTLLRRTKLGFVFQAFHVLPHLTVAGNVGLPLTLLRVPPHEAKARIAAQLETVGLATRAQSRPSELSGGELQRVAIARALIHRPKLVLADEPTGNLDPERAAEVLALLKATIRQEGAVGLMVTHSEAAARSTDRVLRLTHAGLVPA